MTEGFNRVLIANRGEIAVRIAHTLREMGIGVVAVHSDPDRGAPHVLAADEAYPLAGVTSAETYLRGDLIIEVDRAEVQSTGDLRKRLGDADDRALLLVRRGEATIFVPLKQGEQG